MIKDNLILSITTNGDLLLHKTISNGDSPIKNVNLSLHKDEASYNIVDGLQCIFSSSSWMAR